MPDPVPLPWWKFARALAPAVLFWAALVGWLAYLLSERTNLGPETDEASIREWIDEARPYGPEWTADIQSRALKALQGKKAYAALATEMALAADKALPADAPLEQRGNVVTTLCF